MVVAELESVQLAWFFIAAVLVQPARFLGTDIGFVLVGHTCLLHLREGFRGEGSH